jgi:hypothetical protein
MSATVSVSRPLEEGRSRIRLQEPGAVGAQRTVDLLLDRPYREMAVVQADPAVVLQACAEDPVWLPHHDVQPHGELPLLRHGAEDVDVGEGGVEVLERGDPLPQHSSMATATSRRVSAARCSGVRVLS